MYVQSTIWLESWANTSIESQLWGVCSHTAVGCEVAALCQQHTCHTHINRRQRPSWLLTQLLCAAHIKRPAGCTGTQCNKYRLATAGGHRQRHCEHVWSCSLPCRRRCSEACPAAASHPIHWSVVFFAYFFTYLFLPWHIYFYSIAIVMFQDTHKIYKQHCLNDTCQLVDSWYIVHIALIVKCQWKKTRGPVTLLNGTVIGIWQIDNTYFGTISHIGSRRQLIHVENSCQMACMLWTWDKISAGTLHHVAPLQQLSFLFCYGYIMLTNLVTCKLISTHYLLLISVWHYGIHCR